jgi:CheY-like chemotaxis protein
MVDPLKYEILVVDDNDSVRGSIAMLLQASGYNVITAANGFEALTELKKKLPDIVLSDLNMPQMSGFELLSVVRRRFPELSVIAMSGAYETGDAIPGGAIADAFYSKGHSDPSKLLRTVAELIRSTAADTVKSERTISPVWIPLAGSDSAGDTYLMVTCTECLRSFPLTMATEHKQQIQETPCLFCANTVRYMIDFSRTAAPASGAIPIQPAPKKKAAVN